MRDRFRSLQTAAILGQCATTWSAGTEEATTVSPQESAEVVRQQWTSAMEMFDGLHEAMPIQMHNTVKVLNSTRLVI